MDNDYTQADNDSAEQLQAKRKEITELLTQRHLDPNDINDALSSANDNQLNLYMKLATDLIPEKEIKLIARRRELTKLLTQQDIDVEKVEKGLGSANEEQLDLIEKLAGDHVKEEPDVDLLHDKIEDIERRLTQLGVTIEEDLKSTLSKSNENQLDLLMTLGKKIEAKRSPTPSVTPVPYEEVLEIVEQIGAEYVGLITEDTLAEADISTSTLSQSVERLVSLSRAFNAVPPGLRSKMWYTIHSDLISARHDYSVVQNAIEVTGISAALEANRHFVLRNLQRDMLPALDLHYLKLAGFKNPEGELLAMVRNARNVPDSYLLEKQLEDLLIEGRILLEELDRDGEIDPPKPKKWVGWGKLIKGMGAMGANIGGGLAMVIGVPLFAEGMTLTNVLASCGAGFGELVEGIGALRGEE